MIGALFGELLQVDVLDAWTKNRYPVFGKLKQHDVAGVEVNANVLVVEAVHERIHILRT